MLSDKMTSPPMLKFGDRPHRNDRIIFATIMTVLARHLNRAAIISEPAATFDGQTDMRPTRADTSDAKIGGIRRLYRTLSVIYK